MFQDMYNGEIFCNLLEEDDELSQFTDFFESPIRKKKKLEVVIESIF